MKKYFVLALLSLLAVPTVSVASEETASSTSSGPEINVEDKTFLNETEDKDGLKRVGTFNKFHFFGYGEIHYNNYVGSTPNEIDFHRLVLGFGYDFNEWIEFRAELDFEHAFQEPELEYAYIDFLIKEYFNVRAGAILLPVGVINQHHEPPLFNSVERPELYRLIIPTTWQEGGAGFHGKFLKGFEYELYVMSSLSAVDIQSGAIDGNFSGSSGFRGGRQRVGHAPGSDFLVSGRLQYKGVPGLRLGTSAVVGNTGQGKAAIDGGTMAILEADAKYSFEGIDIEGTVAYTHLSDADKINNFILAKDPTFTNFVAKEMLGWNLELAYHLFHHLMPDTKHDLIAFVRYEDINTQHSMPSGFAANPANNRNYLTFGLSYLPIPQVAVKADYMTQWNEANGGVDQFNLGLGFYY